MEVIMTPEEKLQKLGYELEPAKLGDRVVISWVRTGNLLFLSGKTPTRVSCEGQVGKDVTTEQAYEAARDCAVSQLAAAKAALGDLSKVRRVVKVLGMVNSAPGYSDQPKVVNGFSDLLFEVLG